MSQKLTDKLIPDYAIDATLAAVFSKPSIIVHTIWFVLWFLARLDVGLLTNIVSLEAIYVGVLIGIQQINHHEKLKKHVTKHKKEK